MTLFEPTLFLKRLVIQAKGERAYDEEFHLGVNLIRGVNSSGKSSIADFIFYVLGGELAQLKPEQAICDTVFAEITINGIISTLRRYVDSEHPKTGVSIFMGSLEEASKSAIDGWQMFPAQRSAEKESFSQVMFRLLGIPFLVTESNNAITMHQILRVLCVDQLSRAESLMRDERFDTELTRLTVRDLLYGVYENGLYEAQMRLKALKSLIENARAEQRGLRDALSSSGLPTKHQEIEALSAKIQKALYEVDAELKVARLGEGTFTEEYAKAEVNLRERLQNARKLQKQLEEEEATLNADISDSEAFVQTLLKRIESLNESQLTEQMLGRMFFHVCPECLQPIKETDNATNCRLCNQPFQGEVRTNRIARMKHELASQKIESETGLATKHGKLKGTLSRLREQEIITASLQVAYDELSSNTTSSRDGVIDHLFERRNEIKSQIQVIEFQSLLVRKITDADGRIKSLSRELLDLEATVKSIRETQGERMLLAETKITEITRYFLHKDLKREAAFSVADEVFADFERNTCRLDGRKAISFSASSVVYFRAAVQMAIFFASLELSFFRYPRFILNDNIEDKGMEERRSQNFQRLIVQKSKEASAPHQIIITTSMIAPEFEGGDLCVGDFYTGDNKTLKVTAQFFADSGDATF